MDLALRDHQRMLTGSLDRVLARHYDPVSRRAMLQAPLGGQGAWPLLAKELGLAGLMIASEDGGQGGTAVDAMLVMDAVGRRLVLDPVAECCVVAPTALRLGGADRAVMSAVNRGLLRIVPVLLADSEISVGLLARRGSNGFVIEGEARFVIGGPCADQYLVAAREPADSQAAPRAAMLLLLVPARAEGLVRTDYRMVDGREASDLRFDSVDVAAEALIGPAALAKSCLEGARNAAIAALCAEAVGVMREITKSTVDYVGKRWQFGAPLSSFQAVRHRIAEMALAIELADAIMVRATYMLEDNSAHRSEALSAAKVVICDAIRTVAQSAVQLHGGMGIAEDSPVTHYFRRATVIEGQFGFGAHHLARYEVAFSAHGGVRI